MKRKFVYVATLFSLAVVLGLGLQACGKLGGLGVGGKLIVSGAGN
jgi:hypothetical protein